MKIKFTKNHPSGITHGKELVTNEKFGNRMIEQGFAEDITNVSEIISEEETPTILDEVKETQPKKTKKK